MGKNQYTEIDKLFKSKLDEKNLASGAWNKPSDDPFLSAMEKVNAQEPKKKKRIIWPFFLFPFFALLSFAIWNTLKVDQLRSTISEMQKEEAKVETETKAETETKEGTETKAGTKAPQVKMDEQVASLSNKFFNSQQEKNQKLLVTEIDNESETTPIDKSNTIINNKSKTTRKSGQTNPGQLVPPTNNEKFEKAFNQAPISSSFAFVSPTSVENSSESAIATSITQRRSAIDAFSLLSGMRGNLNLASKSLPELRMDAVEYSKDEIAEKNKSISLYAFMDINLNSLRMSGLESDDYSLINYDKSYLGYDLGIGALQEINDRFGISYHLVYRRVKNKSLFSNEMEFDVAQLTQGTNGELEYNFVTDLQTPTGSFRELQTVAVLDGNIQDQEMMQQSTNINQLFDFVSIGIKPRVNVWSSNNLNLFAEAGMNINYLLSFCQNIDMKMYFDNKMMMNKEMEDHSMSTLNRFSLAASIGLGIEYKFGEHVLSSFKLGSSRSINSIRQQGVGADNVGTYIDNLGVSLTAGYKF